MTEDEINKYYQRFHVPDLVIAHMKAVAQFASDFCEQLSENHNEIDKNTVVESALLHDCLRVCDIRNFEPEKLAQNPSKEMLITWKILRNKYGEIGHETAMAEILQIDGHLQHAQIVKMHAFFLIDELETLEEKVLYYSDKRVEFDQFVTLSHRFEEGRKRNFGKEDDLKRVLATEAKVFELEKELNLLI